MKTLTHLNNFILTKLDDGINIGNFNLNILQQKLIELERTIFSNMINEKTLKVKSSSKNSNYDEMNSLSEKIKHLTKDNKNMK